MPHALKNILTLLILTMSLTKKLWEETELPLRLTEEALEYDYHYQQLINQYYEQESN